MSERPTLKPNLRVDMQILNARKLGRGFTLVELVTVVALIAGLAAVAVPRFSDMSTAARVAAVRSAHGAIAAAATGASLRCRLTSGCFVAAGPGVVMPYPDGLSGAFWYGAPTASDIKSFVVVDGLAVVTVAIGWTEFRNLGARDPTQCMVRYVETPADPGNPVVSVWTSGC